MSRCVRDADRLDSLKPNYTVNDVSSEICFTNGAVDVKCTRFKTRIRQSGTQVRPTAVPAPFGYRLNCMSDHVGNYLSGCSISSSRPTKAKSKDA